MVRRRMWWWNTTRWWFGCSVILFLHGFVHSKPVSAKANNGALVFRHTIPEDLNDLFMSFYNSMKSHKWDLALTYCSANLRKEATKYGSAHSYFKHILSTNSGKKKLELGAANYLIPAREIGTHGEYAHYAEIGHANLESIERYPFFELRATKEDDKWVISSLLSSSSGDGRKATARKDNVEIMKIKQIQKAKAAPLKEGQLISLPDISMTLKEPDRAIVVKIEVELSKVEASLSRNKSIKKALIEKAKQVIYLKKLTELVTANGKRKLAKEMKTEFTKILAKETSASVSEVYFPTFLLLN